MTNDIIQENLEALSVSEKNIVAEMTRKILRNDFEDVKLEKFKNRNDIFRICSKGMRMIYRAHENGFFLLALERNMVGN